MWSRVFDPARESQDPPTQPQELPALRFDTKNLPTIWTRCSDRVAAMPPIVLGKDIAEDLGATLNSVVLVTSPQGELTPFGLVPKYSRFRVVGIFNSGFFDYDSSWAFARLSDTQIWKAWATRSRCSNSRLTTSIRPEQIVAAAGTGCRQGLHGHQLDGAEQSSLPRPAAGAAGHVHHHRPDRVRRRPEYSDLAHHDGDGEDPRHRRAHVHGHAQIAGAPHCLSRRDC